MSNRSSSYLTPNHQGLPSTLCVGSRSSFAEASEDSVKIENNRTESRLSKSKSEMVDSGPPRQDANLEAHAPTHLSQLSDYLSFLSSHAEVRTLEQWKQFFKPGKNDHFSSHLEDRDGQKVKKLKSEKESFEFSLPKSKESRDGNEELQNRKANERERPDDSGIGGDISSISMMRESSSGTGSSMSILMGTGVDGKDLVGDPEVLEYMQRYSEIGNVPSSRDVNQAEGQSSRRNSRQSDTDKSKGEVQVNNGDAENRAVVDTDAKATSAEASPPTSLIDAAPDSKPLSILSLEGQKAEEPVVAALAESYDHAQSVSSNLVSKEEPAPDVDIECIPEGPRSVNLDSHYNAIPQETSSESRNSISRTSERTNGKRSRKAGESEKKVDIKDFDVIRVLGKGCAGKVSPEISFFFARQVFS